MLDSREENYTVTKVRSEAPVTRRSQRVLTVEDVAAIRAARAQRGVLESSAATTEVPAQMPAPMDEGAALRQARLGFFAVATLVLLLVWIMQRRKGV